MYKAVIGLEVHCELETKSKNFSTARNSYEDMPNINLDPTCLAYPGILPVLNKEAVRKSLQVALALNCQIPQYLMFDRKNYFYPDLPKGYQITQFTNPIGTKGYLDILVNDVKKRVYITDTHLEEDTANLEHKSNYSLINYNRAGVPLLETVTDPCINSAEEALAFLENLRSMFLYLGVSQARADRGQIRCDVNVSLHKENEPFGTRVEIKNVNSFGNVYKVILGEIKRQTDILNNNGVIDQETRRYDEALDVTVAMRSKVDAIDYKYYVEPNIPKIKIEESFIDEVKQTIPKLQYERYENYNNLNISKVDINKIIKEKVISDFFDECLALGADPIKCCNLFVTNVLFILNKENKKINELYLKPSHLVDIMNLLENNTISSKQAKELISKTNELEKEPMVLVKELNMEQVTDSSLILSIVNEVLDEQVEAIEEIKAGRDKKVNFLIGLVMKKSKGQANPALVSKLLTEEISKR